MPSRDPISKGLAELVKGLQPYIADRVNQARQETGSEGANRYRIDELQDAQGVLVFMWDHWNSLFRHDLSFVERSLVSELREFRNRWAHQHPFSENDVYRFLDDADRLLTAINSPRASEIRHLRTESLKRLYQSEVAGQKTSHTTQPAWKSMALCVACAVAIDTVLLSYFHSLTAIILAIFILALFLRIGRSLTTQQLQPIVGPHECLSCSKVIYSEKCPYCATEEFAIPVMKSKLA